MQRVITKKESLNSNCHQSRIHYYQRQRRPRNIFKSPILQPQSTHHRSAPPAIQPILPHDRMMSQPPSESSTNGTAQPGPEVSESDITSLLALAGLKEDDPWFDRAVEPVREHLEEMHKHDLARIGTYIDTNGNSRTVNLPALVAKSATAIRAWLTSERVQEATNSLSASQSMVAAITRIKEERKKIVALEQRIEEYNEQLEKGKGKGGEGLGEMQRVQLVADVRKLEACLEMKRTCVEEDREVVRKGVAVVAGSMERL